MNIKKYVEENKLRPADAIVVGKKGFNLINHYAIFLGHDIYGNPEFSANFTEGVGKLKKSQIETELEMYEPKRIERFTGSWIQRRSAVDRAIKFIGERSYSFFGNNCEHYKNYVHYGRWISNQVYSAGAIALVVGAVRAIDGYQSENNEKRNWGAAIAVIGIILLALSHRTKDEAKLPHLLGQ